MMSTIIAFGAVVACSSSEDSSGSAPGTGGGAGGGTGDGTGGDPGANASSPGEAAVLRRGCPKCHSNEGNALSGASKPLDGYGPDVKLYGPNLTPDPKTGIGSWTDGQLRLGIRDGIDQEGMVLCPQMEHYRTMPDEEVNAIITYLRSLPPVVHETPGSVCPPLKR